MKSLEETGPSYDQIFVSSGFPGQMFGTKYRNFVQIDMTINVRYLFVLFYCYYQSFISGRKTWHWISSSKFKIFLVFSTFLRSSVLSHPATRQATRIQSFFFYQISSYVYLVANLIFTKSLYSSKTF